MRGGQDVSAPVNTRVTDNRRLTSPDDGVAILQESSNNIGGEESGGTSDEDFGGSGDTGHRCFAKVGDAKR